MWPLQTRLSKGLWHTTHPGRLASILQSGLKAEPNIADNERWKTSSGREHYPFVRMIGGVSLFDFTGFDPEIYSRSHPLSSWTTFVPHRRDWGGAVWIEIDRAAIDERFISADDLVRRWNDGGHHRHTIMPRIECACIGDVPISSFTTIFMTWNQGAEIKDIATRDAGSAEYLAALDQWQASKQV